MRRPLAVVPLAVSLTVTLLSAGCVSQTNPGTGQGVPTGGYPPPPGGPDSQAPVVITVQQGNVNTGTGETDVIVYIDVQQPIRYASTLTVTPPAGGQLTAGMPQEGMNLTQQGRLQRTFRVRTASPLAQGNALHVVLHGESGAMGVHAERWLPPAPEMRVQQNQSGPPGGRPPTSAPPGMAPPGH